MPAQRWTAVAGHRLRRERGLSAAQLVHRPEKRLRRCAGRGRGEAVSGSDRRRDGRAGVSEVRSTCCYCGTGCGVIIRSEGDRVIDVRGDPEHPSNLGRLSSKGTTLHLTMTPGAMAMRARHPEMRTVRSEARRRVSWDEALDHIADRFAQIIETHGR